MTTEEYRVVFRGRILPGFDEMTVRSKAERRLRAGSDVIERLFSGRSAVLKKGLSLSEAEHYVSALRSIGMDVQHEQPRTAPQARPPRPARPDEDHEKTLIASPESLAAFLRDPPAMPPPAKQPRIQAQPVANTLESASTLVADAAALNRYLDAASDYTGQESVMPRGSPIFPAQRTAGPARPPVAPPTRPELDLVLDSPTEAQAIKPAHAPAPPATPAPAVTPTRSAVPAPAPALARSPMASPFGAANALSGDQVPIPQDPASADDDDGLSGLASKLIMAGALLATAIVIVSLAWWLI